jgi:hypothetical protein
MQAQELWGGEKVKEGKDMKEEDNKARIHRCERKINAPNT